MTKKIVAVMALSLVASSAFASQAKNLVTGGGDAGFILGTNGMSGSFYTSDEYNIFWNPAFINSMKNWAVVENGSTAGDGGTSAGFVTDAGAFNVGVFLNHTDISNGGQPIDLVVGGDTGMKWGVGLTQSMKEGAPSTTKLKAGVMAGAFEPFFHFTLKDSDGATAENKDSGMTVGTRYHHGDWTPYAAFTTTKHTAAGVEAANANSTYGVGLGRAAKLGDVHMNYAVSYWHNTNASDKKGSVVPVDMDFSADASSWLTVRASFSHNLVARGTQSASTSTKIGATAHMGKADLDMALGASNNSDTGSASNNTDSHSFGFADNLVANAGLTYRW